MRKDPFTIGDYVHVYNRGNRKMPIVYDENDKWRFLKILRYFNDQYSPNNIFREISQFLKSIKSNEDYRKSNCRSQTSTTLSTAGLLWHWPPHWPPHRPLVKILCFCLAPNHFHLLLKEIIAGGVTKFMAKLGSGFTNYINIKYDEVGRVFQGAYKGRRASEMTYLQYLNVYLQVSNPLELYPGGLEKAIQEFDKAFESALNYKFASLPEFFGKRNLGIIDKDIFEGMFPNLKSYKEFAYDCLLKKDLRKILGKLAID